MGRSSLLAVIPLLFCFGCGEGLFGEDEEDGPKHPWGGTWKGTVNCQGYYEDSKGRQPFQGGTEIEARFDEDGHLLFPVNGKLVPQTHEGQHDKWSPGGGVSQRLLTRFEDNGDHRVYVFKETYEDTDANGSFNQTIEEGFDLRREGDTIRGTYQLRKRSVSSFVSEFGSGRSESVEEAQCEGELKRR